MTVGKTTASLIRRDD